MVPPCLFCPHKADGKHNSGGLGGAHYCTNGGICRAGPADSHLYKCECPQGYQGHHCELNKNDLNMAPPPLPWEKCHTAPGGQSAAITTCQNGGRCNTGFKHHGILHKFDRLQNFTQNKATQEQLEHCICPPGFAGVLCETEVELCTFNNSSNTDNNDHTNNDASAKNSSTLDPQNVCLNGGRCTLVPNRLNPLKPRHRCQCPKGYSGYHCEHKATVFCPAVVASNINNHVPNHFCTNGGTCQNGGFCHCPEGFTGSRCEVEIAHSQLNDDNVLPSLVHGEYDTLSTSTNTQNEEDQGNNSDPSISVILGVIGGITLVVGLYAMRKKRHQNTNHIIETSIQEHGYRDEDIPTTEIQMQKTTMTQIPVIAAAADNDDTETELPAADKEII